MRVSQGEYCRGFALLSAVLRSVHLSVLSGCLCFVFLCDTEQKKYFFSGHSSSLFFPHNDFNWIFNPKSRPDNLVILQPHKRSLGADKRAQAEHFQMTHTSILPGINNALSPFVRLHTRTRQKTRPVHQNSGVLTEKLAGNNSRDIAGIRGEKGEVFQSKQWPPGDTKHRGKRA